MDTVENIVDDLIEGKNTFSKLIQKALAWDTVSQSYDFNFAFALGVNFDEAGMAEDGVDQEAVDWGYENDQLVKVERNVLLALQGVGISTRSEGHGSGGDLVGSACILLNPPHGVEGLKLIERYLEGPGEPFRTSSGTLPSFISDRLFEGVESEIVKRYTYTDLTFYELEELQRFFDLINDGLTPDEAVTTIRDTSVSEAFLAAPEPTGVFRSDLGGKTIFSARCPACKRIHGNFRTFEQAAANKMCRYCIRGYVDKITKVRETGNFKTLLKKDHAKARH